MENLRRLKDLARCISPIPTKQLIRRCYLVVLRRWQIAIHRTGVPLEESNICFTNLPEILGKLRAPAGTLKHNHSGWEAKFLGKTLPLGEKIEWEDSSDSGAMQLWRMNLHYFEYLPQLDSSVAQVLVEDWISSCRPFSTTAWKASWNSYTISLRISSWTDYFSSNILEPDCELRRLIGASLIEQTRYLIKHLETDILGNHVIKNIRALTEASYFLSQHPESETWREIANSLLVKQLSVQILNDGVHYEKSMSYHSQVFADLLAIYALIQDQKIKELLGDKLYLMSQPLIDLCHPDGKIIQFNDSGLDMAVHPKNCLAVYRELLKKSDSGKQQILYPDAGYFGFRSEQFFIVVKMGSLGPDELMAHAHGDWGSFECSVHGKRIFVDQGVYEYIHGEKRQISRSTYSHNTATVDASEQANFIGSFRCAYRPSVSSATYEVLKNEVAISGTIEIKSSLKMLYLKRKLKIGNSALSILDQSPKAKILESAILIHPDWEVIETTKCSTVLFNPEISASVLVSVSNGVLAVEQANWWPNMGQSVITKRLRIKANEGELNTYVATM